MARGAGWRSIVALGFAGVIACGADDDTSGPSPQDVDGFLDRLCGAAGSCCAELGPAVPSVEDCKTSLTRNAPGYVPELGEACIARIGADSAGQCFRFDDYPDDPCFHMFDGRYGSTAPGGTCEVDVECEAPPGGTSKCNNGKCQWQYRGEAGDTPCVGTSRNGITLFFGDGSEREGFLCAAEDGVFCDIAARPYTCRAFRAVGEPCLESKSCASGRCSGECTTTPCDKVCVDMPTTGEQCEVECAPGYYCDRTTRLCMAPKPPGSACENKDECTTGVCDQEICSRLTFPQNLMADILRGNFL